ncbi:hypothetical protein BU14_0072s0008 [Porphyra umbilicalis]|uniref:Protein kinase domain-containing protein n=1 Tax=Porphyra umbilicalis TaxID=2786 RepID=A0A1X6PFN9_PORUM|nr:hypothetical protein BU14_0072s0008 [Porphyra umbilicalis]|eukprot:OSX79650.1 hypothetical protein BU14_0072s0008 [Porphyra umbilicalis]
MRTRVGSLIYAAPELADAPATPYDGAKADAWAVGVLAYMMLVGAHPWVGADGELLLGALRAGELELPPGAVPPGAAVLLRGLLTVDPGARTSVARARLDPWLVGGGGRSRGGPTPSGTARPSAWAAAGGGRGGGGE